MFGFLKKIFGGKPAETAEAPYKVEEPQQTYESHKQKALSKVVEAAPVAETPVVEAAPVAETPVVEAAPKKKPAPKKRQFAKKEQADKPASTPKKGGRKPRSKPAA